MGGLYLEGLIIGGIFLLTGQWAITRVGRGGRAYNQKFTVCLMIGKEEYA